MIKREKYISEIRGFYGSDLIKIITGVRRCGKSVVLEQVMDEIRQMSDNIVFLNFEDRLVTEKINTWKDIVSYVEDRRTSELCYVFLDEVQEIEDWQLACKTLRLRECSVFITGSNSKLLSGEFTKELSGRYVSFRIRPFVFKEVTEYATELDRTVSETDYLIWGGFPKRLEFDTESEKTIISKEYSKAWKLGDEPYYPVNNEKNNCLYNQYKEEALKLPNVTFGGRLGLYKYYDMDDTIIEAFKVLKDLEK